MNGQKWINTLLVVVLGIFVLVILFEFIQLSGQKKNLSSSPPVVVDTGKNLNQNNFELLKKQVQPNSTTGNNVIESRFWGVITNISKTSSGLTITLTGKQKPYEGKEVTYTYPTSVLPRISVYQQETAMILDDVKKGDEVYIDEKTDLAKVYPEAIVGVKITKIN